MSFPHGFCHCGCGQRTNLSRDNDAPRGYVKGEPFRYVRGHAPKARKGVRYREEDRGYETPCWVWQLATQPNGYGHLGVRANQGGAHRWYWEQRYGPIPAGAHVDHLCRVRVCVNPDHMELVTCAENARRGDNAKLDYEAVDEIKRLRATGCTQREVADRFGICRQTVSDIERGLTWSAPGGVIPLGA